MIWKRMHVLTPPLLTQVPFGPPAAPHRFRAAAARREGLAAGGAPGLLDAGHARRRCAGEYALSSLALAGRSPGRGIVVKWRIRHGRGRAGPTSVRGRAVGLKTAAVYPYLLRSEWIRRRCD